MKKEKKQSPLYHVSIIFPIALKQGDSGLQRMSAVSLFQRDPGK